MQNLFIYKENFLIVISRNPWLHSSEKLDKIQLHIENLKKNFFKKFFKIVLFFMNGLQIRIKQ